MAIIPNVSMTNFGVSSSSGWDTDEYGQAWTVSAAAGATNVRKTGGYGLFNVTAGQGGMFAKLGGLASRSDYEVLSLSEHNTTSLVTHGPMIAINGSNQGYAARVTNTRFSIVAPSGASGLVEMNGVDLSTSLEANRKFWIRLQYNSATSEIRAKWWYFGTAEPSSWGVTSAVGSYSISGAPGYFARDVSVSYQVKVHALYVLRAGASSVVSVPLSDTFGRTRTNGWGVSTQKHVWLGHANLDPSYYAQTVGDISVNGSTGILKSAQNNRLVATNSSSKNARIRTKFTIAGSNTNPILSFGLRGALSSSSGSLTYTGYEAQVKAGSNQVNFYKKTGLTGGTTSIGTITLPFAFAKGTAYVLDFQANGSQLAVKAWAASGSEPAYDNGVISDSSITAAGIQFLHAQPNGTSEITYTIDDFTIEAPRTITLAPSEPEPEPDPTVISVITDSLVVSGVTDTTATFKAAFTKDDDNTATVLFQYRKPTDTAWTSINPSSYSRGTSPKYGVVTVTGLSYNTAYEVQATYSDNGGVSGTNPRKAVFSTSYLGIAPSTLAVKVKEESLSIVALYAGDENATSTATVTVKMGNTTVVNAVPMVAARTQKRFEIDLGGLTANTTYTVSVVFSDADGVYGAATKSTTVKTLGAAVELEAVSVSSTMTTATVITQYRYDANNNSSVSIQYRRKGITVWTTLPQTQINVNRSEKTFVATITGLTINIGYDLLVTISDPDGLSSNSPATIQRAFSTTGTHIEAARSAKTNVYRIYDPDGNFVGSWGNGPAPKFSLEENGGVTNLSVTLPKSFSEAENDKTIDYLNRVDVWCIDGEAQGMGVNLVTDPFFGNGAWTIPAPWGISSTAGADGLNGLRLTNGNTTIFVRSEQVELPYVVPLVMSALVRAQKGKVRIDLEAFDQGNNSLGTSKDNAESVGTDWQQLILEWLPPPSTAYVRVRIEAVGTTTCYVSHVSVLVREMLIYRGTIETYEPQLDSKGERVQIDILGLTSYLTDGYIEFMQWVDIQPSKDIAEKRLYSPPTDPANMVKDVIDFAKKSNPKFPIYYTPDSIKMTNEVMSYTLRDCMFRDALDKIVTISPPSWHWFVDQTGCLYFRGPEHATTHRLTVNVEVMEYKNSHTVRNMKNHIMFKGRQDSDSSEPDNNGSITVEVSDAKSIQKYGKRTAKFQDSNITDPDTAMMYAEGKLEELGQPEEAGVVKVPDEKDMRRSITSLRGYNIQAFLPGDLVEIRDPENGPYKTYWDSFNWDEGVWDTTTSKVVSMAVPLKAINYNDDHVVLELSHRRPSANGDFMRLAARLRKLESKEANGDY